MGAGFRGSTRLVLRRDYARRFVGHVIGSRLRHLTMEFGTPHAYPIGMSIMNYLQDFPARRPEATVERQARIEREEAIIAKAEADIDAGHGVEDDDVENWLDGLDHDPDAPLSLLRVDPVLR